MDITQEKIEDLNVLINVELSSEDYMDAVETSLKKYSKQVKVNGFRSGHVPKGMIKKMYGKDILAEELSRLAGEQLNKYINDQSLNILGNPMPKADEMLQLDINASKSYKFAFELGLQPEFNIKAIEKKAKVTKYVIEVDDKLLNEEIGRMQKRFGGYEFPNNVQETDILYVDFKSNDANAIVNNTALSFEDVKDKSLKKSLLSAKPGDVFKVNMTKSFGRTKAESYKHFLNIEELAPEHGDDYTITIEKVRRLKEAALDTELFDKVYGEGTVKTAEEFKNKVKVELGEMLDNESISKLNVDMQTMLLEETKIPLPLDFLKRWLLASHSEKVNESNIDEEFVGFEKGLKWNLISNKVAKAQDIKVEMSEVEARTKDMLRMEYGIIEETTEPERFKELLGHFMQNQDHVNRIFDSILALKVFEYLRTELSIKEKKVNYDKFVELANK